MTRQRRCAHCGAPIGSRESIVVLDERGYRTTTGADEPDLRRAAPVLHRTCHIERLRRHASSARRGTSGTAAGVAPTVEPPLAPPGKHAAALMERAAGSPRRHRAPAGGGVERRLAAIQREAATIAARMHERASAP